MKFGEATKACLSREISEELGFTPKIDEHIYTCDRVIENQFNPTQQVLGVYYKIETNDATISLINKRLNHHIHQYGLELTKRIWCHRYTLINLLTFEMDQLAAQAFLDYTSR